MLYPPPPRKRPLSTTTAAAVVVTQLFKYHRKDLSHRVIYDYDHGKNQTPRKIQCSSNRHSLETSSKTSRSSRKILKARRTGSSVPRPVAQQELITFVSAQQKTHSNPLSVICKLMNQACSSLFIQVYRFTHPTIIQHALNVAAKDVRTTVLFRDGDELISAAQNSSIILQQQPGRSLFHRKSLVVDNKKLFISTGNFTINSTEQDINLSAIFKDAMLATRVACSQSFTGIIGSQLVSYLPIYRRSQKSSQIGIHLVQDLIQNAKSNILIAMYILSHPGILQALQAAAERGVKVEVAVDTRESKQTQRTLERLQLSLPLRVRKPGSPPLHVKMCCIDNKILIIGSSNWSFVGLARNTEDLFVIRGLTETQCQSLSEIWQSVQENTQPVKRSREEEEDPLEGTSTSQEDLSPPTKKRRIQ
ncbi:phospholipase D-like domain-containing protein [Chlamydia muridarum]|uniref:phospholipase D-like domain-containing protein n=1 Tax=Chlamydia muridarum TaxID=83560 RepID=UPI001F1719F2|nr:phospholipase D-like domain-containing protein [Chlamydia muridarum]